MSKTLAIKNKFYLYFPLRFLADKAIKKITKRTVNSFIEFIKEGERVLDIGPGCGWIAQELQKRKRIKTTLLDVINLNQTDLPFFIYDGRKIPFSENSFDTTLLIHVLHHCDEPQEVLKETRRVTRDKIIIIEEAPSSWFGRVLLYFRDTFNNLAFWFFFGGIKNMVNLPFNFKKIPEWRKIFKKLDLEITYIKKFPSLMGTPSVIFVVQKL